MNFKKGVTFTNLKHKTAHMLYDLILSAKKESQKLLAILIDPDKVALEGLRVLAEKINQSPATHIFVGGSSFDGNHLDEIIFCLKEKINLPILLFLQKIRCIQKKK